MPSEELHALLLSDISQGLSGRQGLTNSQGLSGQADSQGLTGSQGLSSQADSQEMQVDRPQGAPSDRQLPLDRRQLGRQLSLDRQPGHQLTVDQQLPLDRPRDAPLPKDQQLGALSVDNDNRAAKQQAVELRADWMPSGTQVSDDKIEDSSQ